MEDPDETEDNTANDDPFEAHYEKTDAHQQRNGNHDAQFGLSCHATACYKVFEIILIEFGSLKPGVQFFGTSGKAECGKHQEGESRQQWQDGTDGTEDYADAAENDI